MKVLLKYIMGCLTAVFWFTANEIKAQQIKLGNNPTQIEQAAVLELEANNQGLLLTRVADTAAINAFNPPEGMIIYFTDADNEGSRSGVYERKQEGWRKLGTHIALAVTNSSGAPGFRFEDGTYTLNLPNASSGRRGIVSTGRQTWTGGKTLNDSLTLRDALVVGNGSGKTGTFLMSEGYGLPPQWEELSLKMILPDADNGDMLVYQEDEWMQKPAGEMVWLLKGNEGINPDTDFVGTTDGQPLILKVGGNGDPVKDRVGYLGGAEDNANILWGAGSGLSGGNESQVIAIGNEALSGADRTISIGYETGASAENAIAIGAHAKASAQNSVAIGKDALADQPNTFILDPHLDVGIGTSSPQYKLDVDGDINAAGTVRANGVALASDIRYKKDLKKLSDVLRILDSLNAYTYFFRTEKFRERHFPEAQQIGLIAQEIEKFFPQLIVTDPDGYKSLKYEQFTAVLLQALKEQQAEIRELRIKAMETEHLKKRLDRLERLVDKK